MVHRRFSYANEKKVVHRDDVMPRAGFLSSWERVRHGPAHWFAECFSEGMGVFLYCYAGVGSQAAFVIGNLLKQEGLGSLFQVGWAYAAGIMLAVALCSATSGGNFNPCITIVNVLFNKMPPLKGLRYIVAQILGGYIACLLVYAQYSHTIKAIIAATPPAELAVIMFTPNGPAGIFGNYPQTGADIALAFLNEFTCDFFLAFTIFGCIDPTNAFVPPVAVAPIIGMAYAAAIWGFALNGLSANAARDLGGRFAAMTIWGKEAAGPSGFSANTALTNILATILAFLVYEFMMVDSDRVVPQAQREFFDIHMLHRRTGHADHDGEDSASSTEKDVVGTNERV